MRLICAVSICFVLCSWVRSEDTTSISDNKLIPAPSDQQLTAGVTNLKSLYAADYRGAEDKSDLQARLSSSALARKLLTTAEDTPPTNDGYFPMLSEAVRLSTLSSKPEMAIDAIDKLATTHKIDASRMKLDVLSHFAQKSTSLPDVKAASRFVMPAIQNAANTQDLETALAILSVGETIAKRMVDRTMQSDLTFTRDLIEKLQDQESEFQTALKNVDLDQNDASSNLTIAKYFGLRKGSWAEAEVYANRVDEEEVRSLFVRELVNPENPPEILRLANDWWDYAATQTGAVKLQAEDVALSRYASIVKSLKGFEQKQVESRLSGNRRKGTVAVRIPSAVSNNEPEISPTPASPKWINEGLVAYYPFNGNAKDESGNGSDGTLVGARFAADRHNKQKSCLEFRKLGDVVAAPANEQIKMIGATSHTVSLWVNSEVAQERAYMISRNAGNNFQWMCVFSKSEDNSTVEAMTGHGTNHIGAKSCAASLDAANWCHTVISTSADSTTIYVNGVKRSRSQPGVSWPAVRSAPILIGGTIHEGRPASQFFGRIDDVRIYDRPLSDDEAMSLFEFERSHSN